MSVILDVRSNESHRRNRRTRTRLSARFKAVKISAHDLNEWCFATLRYLRGDEWNAERLNKRLNMLALCES